MNRLLSINFKNVGHWELNEDNIQFQLAEHQSTKNVLYSFISNGDIKYIGKTIQPLKSRMYGYQNPGPSQTTNIRVNKKIKEALMSDEAVDIFILVDNGLLKYGEFRINLAAGLEDTLIYQVCPIWNYSGKHKLEIDKNSENEELIEQDKPIDLTVPVVDSFEIILGEAYYNQGFFNVRKQHSDKFGDDKAVMEIQLGNNSENVIQAYINRTANGNGTPRIMGGKTLTDWIHNNFKRGDMVKVDIFGPLSVRLNK